jgi:hypothetical protein
MVDNITKENIPMTPITRMVITSLLRSWVVEQEKKISSITLYPEMMPWLAERKHAIDIVRNDLASIELL